MIPCRVLIRWLLHSAVVRAAMHAHAKTACDARMKLEIWLVGRTNWGDAKRATRKRVLSLFSPGKGLTLYSRHIRIYIASEMVLQYLFAVFSRFLFLVLRRPSRRSVFEHEFFKVFAINNPTPFANRLCLDSLLSAKLAHERRRAIEHRSRILDRT